MATIDKGKLEAISLAMGQIEKQFGKGSIMKLGEASAQTQNIEVIPTGSLAVDIALGAGGLPKGRIVEIFGPESSGKCVTPNTLVFTRHGMLPIGEFGNLKKLGFQNKRVQVFSENGPAYTSHFYNSGIKDTIKIKTRYGFELEGTPNHRIRVLSESKEYVFKRLDQLSVGDRVAIQRGQRMFGNGAYLKEFSYQKDKRNTNGKHFAHPDSLTPDLAKLLGYLVGDGHYSDAGLTKNGIHVTIGDPEVAADFTNLCQSIFSEAPKVTPDKRTSSTARYTIHNAMARSFLSYAGLNYITAKDKQIPYSVMQSPKLTVARFLSSLFESDGTVNKGTIEFCTKSSRLATQVQIALLNFGIVAKKKERTIKNYRGHYQYLYIDCQESKKLFAEEIGFVSTRKQHQLLAHVQKVRMYQSNRDTVPFINSKVHEIMNDYRATGNVVTRGHWDVIYDYLPINKKASSLTYNRISRILNTFESTNESSAYKEFSSIYQANIFWDTIITAIPSRSQVVDFTVPETAAFFGNGFINHNTTIALHTIAEVQKAGGVAAFVDAEHALDPSYAKKIGVNIDELLLSQPDTGEQALEIVETLVRSGAIDVIVVDSVAALTPRAEIEGEMGDAFVGLQARLMSQALRKLTAAVSRSNTLLIFTNQLREKIGVMFGNPETTPGGRALKFYSSVRLDVRRVDSIKEGDRVIGSRVRVKVVKNKIAPPFRVAEFDIMYNEGISRSGSILDVAIEAGVVRKAGAWFSYGEEKLGQGREAVKEYLKENKKLSDEIEKKSREALSGGKTPLEVGLEENEDELENGAGE